MRKPILLILVIALFGATRLIAQRGSGNSVVLVPDSTVQHPVDVGVRAHTNHLIFYNPHFKSTSPSGETPQSIDPVYALTFTGTGGSGVIAIVDAYDYPTAENDLNVFSSQFSLPPCTTANGCLTKVYASATKPRTNCGWSQEAALDIEWAHAMAPNAKIILVEAKTNSFTNLFAAVDVATKAVQSGGGDGEVSMSWGGSEFSSEAGYDYHFQPTSGNIVYFAASGDTGGATIYPSASPYVVGAGGTTINRSKTGSFVSETGWSGSGGGPSKYEAKPSYQSGIPNTSSTQRSVPDFSFDADPASGVSVYDSTSCKGLSGWLVFGGTSVASPSLSGIVNRAGHFYGVSELPTIYINYTDSSDFRDILSGTAGSYSAGPGYDFVTGVGTNQGLRGK